MGLAGERFRRAVLASWELTEPEQMVLDQAAATLDAIALLERQVERDGPMVDGSKGQRVLHPAIGEARAQRLAFSRMVAQLALPDLETGTADVWTPEAVRAKRAAQARWRRQQRGGA